MEAAAGEEVGGDGFEDGGGFGGGGLRFIWF